ncbi:MAG: hypothetical protein K9W46_04655 [Candidatus Heimdallarchaeum endolithica]|uniref:Antitoxin SocA-like Panacea domain-containing protein n=1 Tax=Candidatus Heimdallarchaeum endolithica TaxID=2876572 RepID=A0A9Y1FP57_9ARCH|nr:MAG: hypothetical protein K9W46_04655 [Candidatus Heimdallarchaeum endolithica]
MNQKATKNMSEEENKMIKKWIYLMLAADNNSSIKGKVRITKEFFLITKQLAPEVFKAAQFYPYHFGPYSTRFAVCVNELIKSNHINILYKSGDYHYELSKKGLVEAKKYLKTIPKKEKQVIDDIKKKSKSQSLKSMLKEIYEKYPKYTVRSVIKADLDTKKVNLDSVEKVDDNSGFVSSDMKHERDIVLKGEAAKRFLEIISK